MCSDISDQAFADAILQAHYDGQRDNSMANTDDKLEVAERIKKALEEFVDADEKGRIVVFESSAGNLRAVVPSRKFSHKGPVERQDAVWDFLKKKLDRKDSVQLYGVHAMDPKEFAAEELRQRSSSLAHPAAMATVMLDEEELAKVVHQAAVGANPATCGPGHEARRVARSVIAYLKGCGLDIYLRL